METNRRSTWWRLPLFGMAAGWLCFYLTVNWFRSFYVIEQSENQFSMDAARFSLVSGLLFLATLLVGGLLICRRMTRRQVFLSASVLVALNVVLGILFRSSTSDAAGYWMMCGWWSSIVTDLLAKLGLPYWLAAAVRWAAPYLFVFFGKKNREVSVPVE